MECECVIRITMLYGLRFNCFNFTSKNTKFNITQYLNQYFPVHWHLPLPTNPFLKNLLIDPLSITSVLVFHVADPISIGVIQKKDAKLVILGANLLWNIDPSLPASEPH